VYAIIYNQGFREILLKASLELHAIFRIFGQSKIVKNKIVKVEKNTGTPSPGEASSGE
jgi:hypothetical protein